MNPKKEKLLNDTYQKWMQAVLYDLPLDEINELIDPKIMGYGTAIDEKVFSISEYKQLINRQRKQAVGIEMILEITPVFRNITNKEDAAIFVDEIKVKMIIGSERHELFLRITTLLENINSNWIVVHWHGSKPDHISGGDDPWHVDEWQRKNEELQKLVDEKISELLNKNRELEIETALEKVRSIALSMKEPSDMVEVCKIISDQLLFLGVKDIRNVQTAIIDDHKSSYLNYQYFTAYKEIAIEKAEYNKHPKAREMAETMKKSANAFYSQSFEGEELNIFRQYRKQDNQIPDPILDKAASLHFYFYSIGQGALGISTYNTPLREEDLNLLKRFRNVFELAYRRFEDIEKAEAQAREANIQLALERVRARTMAMHKSEELAVTVSVLFKQLLDLGVQSSQLRTCGIVTFKENEPEGEIWITDITGEIIADSFIAPYDEAPAYKAIYSKWKNGEKFLEINLKGDELLEHLKFVKNYSAVPNIDIDEIQKSISEIFFHVMFFSQGYLFIISYEPLSEFHEIFKRFGSVFQQAYIRFLDLQKAEAQAREAQIETALEKVRSTSLAMNKSEELKEVIRVVYEQFVNLKINVDHAGFVVDYKPKGDWHFWIADEQYIPSKITHPYFESVWANQFNEAKEKGADFFATNLDFKEKNKFYNELLSYVSGLPEASKDFYLSCPGLAGSTVLLENVGLYIENFSGAPYSDEENKILMRFGKVFQQTYTRFLDLQKAEAQAREAKIESALERVRAKAMSMHKSDDLSSAVASVFTELDSLGLKTLRCGIGIFDGKSGNKVDVWTTSSDEDNGLVQVIGDELLKGHPLLEGIYDSWQRQHDYSYVLTGKDFENYYNIQDRSNLKIPKQKLDAANLESAKHYYYCVMFPAGGLYAFREDKFKEEEIQLMKRFADVFHLTFIRHLDLKQAEAQNKIIQADNDRKTKELEDARQLQLSMLPKALPKLSHLDIAVYMKTATEVGGDYYDYILDKDGTLTFIVGDATGHGMMSGMMVSIMKSFFIATQNNIELKPFFENTNNSIKDMHLGRLMMALAAVQITPEKLIATNAGMPALLYFRNKSQKAGEFVSNNLPLGGIKNTNYTLKEIRYEKGDTLLLMSDGFAELKNVNDEQYGYPRVMDKFKSVVQKNSNQIVEHLTNAANVWMNGREPDDDVTFVVIKVK